LLVQTSGVQFVHNGSDETPSFKVNVSDTGVGAGSPITVGPRPVPIRFNHKPVVRPGKLLSNRTETAGQDFDFTINTDVFRDPDNDTLTFTARQSDERDLPSGVEFDETTGRMHGKFTTVSSVEVNITAFDPRKLTASSLFYIHVQAAATSYVDLLKLAVTPAAIFSVATALLGYGYRRWRMWDHRQLNKFADELRLALNIDIYDFSNEEGTDYLRKVDHLIVKLNEDHDQFYKHLTPEQAQRFAGDVATVMRKHPRMLNPAPWYIKGLNWVTCYGRRWVNILNITAFGYETDAIAREAVLLYHRRAQLTQIGLEGVEMTNLQESPVTGELDTPAEGGVEIKRGVSEAKENKYTVHAPSRFDFARKKSPEPVERATLEERVGLLSDRTQQLTGQTQHMAQQLTGQTQQLAKRMAILETAMFGNRVNFFESKESQPSSPGRLPSSHRPSVDSESSSVSSDNNGLPLSINETSTGAARPSSSPSSLG
jgi:hypothetical protein